MGLTAPVVKTHGSADALAVENTIAQIHTMIESKVIEKTVSYFGQVQSEENIDKPSKN